MSIVGPTRMIENGIKADAMDGDAVLDRSISLLADVAKPRTARRVFSAGLGDDHRPMITLMDLLEHLSKRAIKRMGAPQRRELPNAAIAFQVVEPLIVRIKIEADDIKEFLLAAELRP